MNEINIVLELGIWITILSLAILYYIQYRLNKLEIKLAIITIMDK